MTTVTQTITAMPTPAVSRTMAPDAFIAAADNDVVARGNMVGELNTWAGQVNTVAGEVNTNATNAAASAVSAAASAASASAAAGVVEWVSGTTYAIGDTVWSPIDFLTYRRKTAGAGTTDPSADSVNWQLLLAAGAPTWSTKTNADSPFTAVVGEGYRIDTSGGAVTMNLPATLAAGDEIPILDLHGTFATANFTIAQNGHKIETLAEDFVCDINNEARTVIYHDVTIGVTVR